MAGKKEVSASLQMDKGTWVVRGKVYNPDTGKIAHRSKSTGLKIKDHTKRRAEKMMASIVTDWEQEANRETQPIMVDPLFAEYVYNWLDRKQATIRGNTLKAYHTYAEVHILPALGGIRIRKLTLQQLQLFYTSLFQKLSVNSVRKIHVVVSGALLDAVRNGVIPSNIAEYIEFPNAQKYEGSAYTPEQAAHLLRAAESAGEPLRAAVTLALCYGLRRGEIAGLRWQDIDFNQETLFVRNTVVQEGDFRQEEERTKTKKSRRKISLIGDTIPYFKELKCRHEKAGMTSDKVCVWPDGREVRPDYLTKYVPRLMKEAGLPVIRLHDLRHTAASMLAEACSPKQIQEFLGHENISTTMNVYTHIMDKERRATSDAMGAILKKAEFFTESFTEYNATAEAENHDNA